MSRAWVQEHKSEALYLSMYRSSGRMYVRVYTVLFSTQGKIDPELEVYKE